MWAIPKILDFLGVPTIKAMEQFLCSCGDIDWGLTSADTSHIGLMYRIFLEVTQLFAGNLLALLLSFICSSDLHTCELLQRNRQC